MKLIVRHALEILIVTCVLWTTAHTGRDNMKDMEALSKAINDEKISPQKSWELFRANFESIRYRWFSDDEEDLEEPSHKEVAQKFSKRLIEFIRSTTDEEITSAQIVFCSPQFPEITLLSGGTGTITIDGTSSMDIHNADELNCFREMETIWGEYHADNQFMTSLYDELKNEFSEQLRVDVSICVQ